MSLHDEIVAESGDIPAAFIDKRTLSHSILSTLNDTLFKTFTGPIRINPDFDYGAELAEIKVGTGSSGSFDLNSIELDYGDEPDEAILRFSQGLRLKVDVGFVETQQDDTNVFQDRFSTATLLIRHLGFRLIIGNNSISSSARASDVLMSYAPEDDTTLAEIASRRGVTVADLHRIEGIVGSGIQSYLASMLAQTSSIEFADLFPGLTMQGRIRPYVDSDQSYLVLLPAQGLIFEPGGTAGCNGIGDGMGDFEPGTVTPPPSDNQPGAITIGGVTQAHPSTPLGPRLPGIGDIGLYLPRSTARSLTPQILPGVRVRIGSGGTLSWQAEAFVGFTSFDIDFDVNAGAVILEIGFTIDASGWLEADLGKILGRHRIGAFGIEQGGSNSVRVAFVPKISNGEVVIKPIILPGTSIAAFDVWVNVGKFFGLIFGSKGALIGFVFDTILARLVRRKLPGEIRNALNEALSKSAWTLIDIGSWIDLIEGQNKAGLNYDVRQDSILVSVVNHDDMPSVTAGSLFG